MEPAERHRHWENVYAAKSPTEVSWYQPSPDSSLALIERSGVAKDAPILDVGGGASVLVDALLDRGFTDVSVLDISERALRHARERLGDRATDARWIAADVTQVKLDRRFALWHDRAVFHFLVDEDDRRRYRELLRRAVAPGSHVVIAAFGLEGPERCSGLPVQRYSPETMRAALDADLELVEARDEDHVTPAGEVQRFTLALFRRG